MGALFEQVNAHLIRDDEMGINHQRSEQASDFAHNRAEDTLLACNAWRCAHRAFKDLVDR